MVVLVLGTGGCAFRASPADPIATAMPAGPSLPVAGSGPGVRPSAPSTAPSTAPVVATGARLVRATTARSLDAAGTPVDETAVFSSATDREIVLAIQVAGAEATTTVGYRRYLENTFVDGKNTKPTHIGDGTITFSWTKVAGERYPPGAYLVRIVIDGRDVGAVRFTVR